MNEFVLPHPGAPAVLFSSFAKPKSMARFAKAVQEIMVCNMLASGGTRAFLDGEGIKDVVDVAGMVGKAMLKHKVVTLSREVHAGLLADPQDEKEVAELRSLGVPFITMLYVDLYPLEEALAKKDRIFASVIKDTDIGGPAMLRAAAKGGRIVISDPKQFRTVLQHLKKGTASDRRFLSYLAAAAERKVSDYAWKSYQFHNRIAHGGKA